MRSRHLAAIALAAAVVLTAAAFVSSPSSAAPGDDPALAHAQAQLLWCQQARAQARTSAERAWGNNCITLAQRVVDSLAVTPSPTATTTTTTASTVPPSTSAPATTPPTTTPPATTSPPVTTPPAGSQACPPFPDIPDADCTGVPLGTTLTVYDGPCTLTSPVTIERKLITCALKPMSSGIVIRESRIIGSVYGATGANAPSFTIVDSEITAPQATAQESNGLGEANFTAIRVEVTGGNRGVYCRFNCHIEDSWVHGTNIAQSPDIHASAIRQSQGAQIIHNRIHCSAEDTPAGGGCSADLTGYGDFEPVANNLVERNLFVATPGGACAYGGSSGDDGVKPYGAQAHDIRFVDNVFERGPAGDGGRHNCGYYFPITDFDSTRPGNLWTGNHWDSGEVLPPAN